VPAEPGAKRLGLEGFDPQRHVIHVSRRRIGSAAAGTSERGIRGHEIDQAVAGAQLHQPERVDPALLSQPEDLAIEAQRGGRIRDAEHDVVDAEDPERQRPMLPSGRRP
jgi:hypothetical protein